MSHHKTPVKPLPPNDKIYLSTGLLSDERDYAQLCRITSKQPFVSQLDLLVDLPDEHAALQTISQAVANYSFQHARLRLGKLLTPHFMISYIRNGSLIALSCDDGSGDIAAIDGNGRLVLSLTKDTYGSLGIVGTPSKFGQKRHRYCAFSLTTDIINAYMPEVIEVDLREDCMRDGKPGYERLKNGLAKLGEMDMMFSFYTSEDNREQITFPAGISSRSLSSKLARSKTSIDATSISEQTQAIIAAASSKKRKSRGDDEQEDLAAAILENVAGLSVDSCFSSSASTKESSCATISGFLHPKFLAAIQKLVADKNDAKVLAITSATFSHSPVMRAKSRSGKAKATGLDERNTETSLLDGWTLVLSGQASEKRYLLLESHA